MKFISCLSFLLLLFSCLPAMAEHLLECCLCPTLSWSLFKAQPVPDSKWFMLYLQRSLQQSQGMGGQTTIRRAVSGTASSVAFTPLQGLEIVSPQAVEKKAQDAKYFSSTAGFLKVKKQWAKITGPDYGDQTDLCTVYFHSQTLFLVLMAIILFCTPLVCDMMTPFHMNDRPQHYTEWEQLMHFWEAVVHLFTEKSAVF